MASRMIKLEKSQINKKKSHIFMDAHTHPIIYPIILQVLSYSLLHA